jgi:hypothetical protein
LVSSQQAWEGRGESKSASPFAGITQIKFTGISQIECLQRLVSKTSANLKMVICALEGADRSRTDEHPDAALANFTSIHWQPHDEGPDAFF